VPSGVWRVKMFKVYGANPTPLAYAEVYSALQSGVMDGQENPFVQIYSGRFHEVQKYLSLTGHVYSPAYPVVGERWWQTLPAEVRSALERIAVETQEVAWREGERLDKELISKLSATLKVNEADKAAFIEASRPVYDEYAKEVPGGDALIKQFQTLM
jgi:TRAP-type C4-dicarboxylate transport system substrate-binding protein